MAGLILLAAVLLQSTGRQECSIAGHVYSLSTGMPLKKAQVRASGMGAAARTIDTAVTTGEDGSFRIDHLVAGGQYSLMAERNGFLINVATRAGCGAGDVSIKLTPQGMIYGRVIDDDGEGMPNSNVTIYHRAWIRGKRQMQIQMNISSQADGTFVAGSLPSGTYFLAARANGRNPPGLVYVENFFPNSPDAQGAAPVEVAAGAEVRGLELRLRTERAFSITGKLAGMDGQPANGVQLMLVDGRRGTAANAATQGGMFRFQSVAPGSYLIQTVPYYRAREKMGIASVPVSVGDRDVQEMNIHLQPGMEIQGTINLDDSSLSLNGGIALMPSFGNFIKNNSSFKEGVFALENISPGAYSLEFSGLPDRYYVKSVKLGGREQVGGIVEITSGGGVLEIGISSKPAAISGTVRNGDGDPVARAAVGAWIGNGADVLKAYTDEQGRYSLRNLPPGDYRVLAWEAVEPGVTENAEFRASFVSDWATAKLEEGTAATLDLKAVSKIASEAAIAKLP